MNQNLNEAIERVGKMEEKYQRYLHLLLELKKKIEELGQSQIIYEELLEYVQSELFQDDYEKEEDGVFQQIETRAILSEDGMSDLMELHQELMEQMEIISKSHN